MMTTPEEIYERYSVRISQEQLDGFQELQRRAEGPPFRMTIEYPRPVLTEEEEAAALAQAEHDDIMGNFGFDPEDYTTSERSNVVAKFGDWTIENVTRAAGVTGFQLLPRRRVVERTLAWLNRNRRLAKVFETSIASATA